jgi:TP901 family phage tail tape measure protein
VTEAARLEGIISLVGVGESVAGLKSVSAGADNAQAALNNIEKKSRETGRGLDDFGKRMDVTGRRVQHVGGTLTRRVTAPLVGLGVAATKMSMDFNKSMANVATMTDGSSKRIDGLKTAVQRLAIETGKSTGDLADGMYQVLSAFGDTADAATRLKVATRASVAGVSTTTDAINLLSAVTKGYGDTSVGAMKSVSDLAFQTVKLGQTTFPELAASMGRVVPLAASLGVSQQELFAVMATATGVTGKAAEVSTQYRGVLQSLSSPTKKMAELYKTLGVKNGEALLKQKGFAKTLQIITDEARRTNTPLQEYIGSIEGQTLAMALAGPQADTFREKLEQMGETAGATDQAFRSQTEGVNKVGVEWEKAKQRVAVAAQGMGDAIAPLVGSGVAAIVSLATIVERLATGFEALPDGAQAVALGFGAIAIAAGPLLVMTGMAIQGLGALAVAAGAVSLPVIAIGAAAVGAGVGLVALYKNSATAREVVSRLWDIVKASPLGSMARGLQAVVEKLGGWGDVFRHAGIAALRFGEVVMGMALGVTRAVNDLTGNWVQRFATILDALAFVKPEFRATADAVGAMADKSRRASSDMERAMERDLARMRGQINQLKAEILGVPTMRTVTWEMRTRGSVPGQQPTGPRAFAEGGKIAGPGTGTSDDVPAMLSNGEYVIRAASVEKYGDAFMHALNAGDVQAFAKGGKVKRKITPRAAAQNAMAGMSNRFGLQNATSDARLARAENTESSADDRAEFRRRIVLALAQERKWTSFISSKQYRHLDLPGKQQAQQSLAGARRDLLSARASIKALNEAAGVDDAVGGDSGFGGGSAVSAADEAAARAREADMAAQLEQQRRRAANAEANFRLSQGEIRAFTSSGDLGYGGGANAWQSANGSAPTIIVNSLTGYSPEIQQVVSGAAGGGFTQGADAFRSYTGRG